MIISFDAEKIIEKNPTFLCDKSSSESKNTEDYFYELKVVYSRGTTNILLNVEKNGDFPLKLKLTRRQECPLHPLLFNIVLKAVR